MRGPTAPTALAGQELMGRSQGWCSLSGTATTTAVNSPPRYIELKYLRPLEDLPPCPALPDDTIARRYLMAHEARVGEHWSERVLQSTFVLEPALQCLLHELKHFKRAEAGSFIGDAALLLDDLRSRSAICRSHRADLSSICAIDYHAAENRSRT